MLVLLKSTLDEYILGGVPVFNLPISNPNVDNESDNPIADFS